MPNFVTIWFNSLQDVYIQVHCIYTVKFFLQTPVLNANVTVFKCCQTRLMGPSSNIQREFDMYQFDYSISLPFNSSMVAKKVQSEFESAHILWYSLTFIHKNILCNFYVFIIQQSQHRNHFISINQTILGSFHNLLQFTYEIINILVIY